MLEANVSRFKVPAGPPVVAPRPQSRPPSCGPDCLTLHLVARTTKGGAGWGGPPGEDWIVFDRAALTKLLPAGSVAVGTAWEPDAAVLAKLLTHCYPETENNDISKNRIDEQAVRATVVSVTDGVARARLDGRLRMKHPFYHKDDDRVVNADLLGYVEFDVTRPHVRALRLVTTRATYGRGEFAVAVREVRP
jgi:hypothetical protein